MALIPPSKLDRIKRIIAKRHAIFLRRVFGEQALSPAEKRLLSGEKPKPGIPDLVESAFNVGRAQQMVEGINDRTTWNTVKEAILQQDVPPLSDVEAYAVQNARERAGEYIRGLGTKIIQDTTQQVFEANETERQRLLREEVQPIVAGSVARRESLKRLKSTLRARTEEWGRDWDRVARTEMMGAHERGRADAIANEVGLQARVAKIPEPDACRHCLRLYLENGRPKIFTLSQLEENGSNYGRKAADWKPTIWPTHPNCFVAGTLVQTARGRVPIEQVVPGDQVLSLHGRWRPVTNSWTSAYAGEIRKARLEDGRDLNLTPQHEIMTSEGWRPASTLQRGDHLLDLRPQGLVPGEGQTKDSPTMSLQKGRLGRVLTLLSRAGVPVTAIDLHGQLFVRESQVHVETIDGEVHRWLHPGIDESGVQFALVAAPEPTRTGLRAGDATFVRIGLTPPGLVCGSRVGLQALGVAGELPLTAVPGLPSNPFDTSDDGAARGSEAPGYLLHREQFFEVEAEDLRGVEVESKARHVRIVSVTSQTFEGQVFNLSVAGTESYTANGILAHNCQCQLQEIPAGFELDEDWDLVPVNREVKKAEDRIVFAGLPIHIENRKGTERHWQDEATGKSGSTVMPADYGEIEGTRGADGDPYDVFIGPDPDAPLVFIVHIERADGRGYDEDKAFLGFSDVHQVLETFTRAYDDPKLFGAVAATTIEEFREKVGKLHDGLFKAVNLEPNQFTASFPGDPLRGPERFREGHGGGQDSALSSRAGNAQMRSGGLGVQYGFDLPPLRPGGRVHPGVQIYRDSLTQGGPSWRELHRQATAATGIASHAALLDPKHRDEVYLAGLPPEIWMPSDEKRDVGAPVDQVEDVRAQDAKLNYEHWKRYRESRHEAWYGTARDLFEDPVGRDTDV